MEDDSIKRSALLVATLASFLTPFMGSSVNLALPTIGSEMAIDAVLLSWVATSFLLAAAMFIVPVGRISDIMGRKRIFAYGIMIYTVSSLLCALSPTAFTLIAFRVLQGLGSAMIFATGVAIVTSVFPVGERGKALGITIAAVYLGLSLGPILGGVLTQHLGWRSVFLINVPLGLIVIFFTSWKLKGEWADAKGEKFDLAGSIMYSISLVAAMYGLSLLPDMKGVWLIIAGIAGIWAFISWEMRSTYPVLDVRLFFNNRTFSFSNLAALINYSATFGVTFLLSLYLQYIKDLTPQNAGAILIFQPVVMTIFSPFAGRLSDRIEPGIVASAGMTLTSAGLFLLAFIDEGTDVIFIISSLMILGLGFALFSSPNTNAIMSSVEKRFYGIASGTVGTMRLIGQMLSMGIAMLLFALYMGRVQISPEYFHQFISSVQAAFMIFAALCFLGIFASLARGRVRQ